MSRIPGIKKPTRPATAAPETKSKLIDPNEDPIEYSIQVRESAGGLTSQLTEAQAKTKKVKVFSVAKHTVPKGAALIDYVNDDSSSAAGTSSAFSTPKPRPGTATSKFSSSAAVKRSTNSISKVGSNISRSAAKPTESSDGIGVSPNEDLSGADDPIAQSLQDRLKAGGLTSTVKETDLRKLNIKILKVPKHTVKASTTV